MASTKTSIDDAGIGGDATLQSILSRAETGGRGPAPVERWEPAHCGALDIQIRSDGSWHYNGSPIGRERLVRLFSTVLRKDADGETYLVTPVEKIRIEVEDAPFLAVELASTTHDGETVLTFRTNVGDIVEAGPDHPLRFEGADDGAGLKPYLLVRGRLEALLTRSLVHDLVALAEPAQVDGSDVLVVRSKGAQFVLGTDVEA